jgi:hypothetical protein
MLNEATADCLALANTAILMRLIQELIESGVIAIWRQRRIPRYSEQSREMPRIQFARRGCRPDHSQGTDAGNCWTCASKLD